MGYKRDAHCFATCRDLTIHTVTLTDIAAIEGKIYPRNTYVSKGPFIQKRGYSHVLFRTSEGCGEFEE